jgi:hypothetical protein
MNFNHVQRAAREYANSSYPALRDQKEKKRIC